MSGFISKPAFCRPEIKITPVDAQIDFETSKNRTNCSGNAVGCTLCQSCFPDLDVDCGSQKITLDFSRFRFLIQIVDKYQKGTPEFDNIVKHELTHVALYKGVAEKFYQPMATAVLLRFEQSLSEQKSCYQIQNDIYGVFQSYLYRMSDEYKTQNDLIDGEENYAHQWKQIYKNKFLRKKKNYSQMSSRANVRMNMLPIKRQYNILQPESVTVDRFGNPDKDGKGILKNLKTGVTLELDPVGIDVDCETGNIRVNFGFLTTVTFNEQKGTHLYEYLKDSLDKRAAALEKKAENLPGIIRRDIEKTYRRLANDRLSCQEIRMRLNQRMIAYQKKVFENSAQQNKKMGDAVPLWRFYFEKDVKVYAKQDRQKRINQEITVAQNIEGQLKTEKASSLQPPENNKISEQNDQKTTSSKYSEEKQKIKMSATDRFYIGMIKRSLEKLMHIFDVEKKFDDMLKKIRKFYSELTSEQDDSVAKAPKDD